MAKIELSSQHSLGSQVRFTLSSARDLNILDVSSLLAKFEWQSSSDSYEIARSDPKQASSWIDFDLMAEIELDPEELDGASICVCICDAQSRNAKRVVASVAIPIQSLHFPNAIHDWFTLNPTAPLPRLESTPSAARLQSNAVYIVGRIGPLSEINGKYLLLDEKFANKPAYKHESQPYYLFHHVTNPAWMISKSLGAQIAPVYALSAAATPEKITEVWSVANVNKFEKDPAIKVVLRDTYAAPKDFSSLPSQQKTLAQVGSTAQNYEAPVSRVARSFSTAAAPNAEGTGPQSFLRGGSEQSMLTAKALRHRASTLSLVSNSETEDQSPPSDLKIVLRFLEKVSVYLAQQGVISDKNVNASFVQRLRDEIQVDGSGEQALEAFEHLIYVLETQPDVSRTLLATEADRIQLFREISLARVRREELVNELSRLDQEIALKDRSKDSLAFVDLMRKAQRQWANYQNYRILQQLKEEEDEDSSPYEEAAPHNSSQTDRNLSATASQGPSKVFSSSQSSIAHSVVPLDHNHARVAAPPSALPYSSPQHLSTAISLENDSSFKALTLPSMQRDYIKQHVGSAPTSQSSVKSLTPAQARGIITSSVDQPPTTDQPTAMRQLTKKIAERIDGVTPPEVPPPRRDSAAIRAAARIPRKSFSMNHPRFSVDQLGSSVDHPRSSIHPQSSIDQASSSEYPFRSSVEQTHPSISQSFSSSSQPDQPRSAINQQPSVEQALASDAHSRPTHNQLQEPHRAQPIKKRLEQWVAAHEQHGMQKEPDIPDLDYPATRNEQVTDKRQPSLNSAEKSHSSEIPHTSGPSSQIPHTSSPSSQIPHTIDLDAVASSLPQDTQLVQATEQPKVLSIARTPQSQVVQAAQMKSVSVDHHDVLADPGISTAFKGSAQSSVSSSTVTSVSLAPSSTDPSLSATQHMQPNPTTHLLLPLTTDDASFSQVQPFLPSRHDSTEPADTALKPILQPSESSVVRKRSMTVPRNEPQQQVLNVSNKKDAPTQLEIDVPLKDESDKLDSKLHFTVNNALSRESSLRGSKTPVDSTIEELSQHIEKLESHLRSSLRRRKPAASTDLSSLSSPTGSFTGGTPTSPRAAGMSPAIADAPLPRGGAFSTFSEVASELMPLAEQEQVTASAEPAVPSTLAPLFRGVSTPEIIISVPDVSVKHRPSDQISSEVEASLPWPQAGILAKATSSYSSGRPSGLRFRAGDVLKIIDVVDDYRVKVVLSGEGPNPIGIVPITTIDRLDSEEKVPDNSSPDSASHGLSMLSPSASPGANERVHSPLSKAPSSSLATHLEHSPITLHHSSIPESPSPLSPRLDPVPPAVRIAEASHSVSSGLTASSEVAVVNPAGLVKQPSSNIPAYNDEISPQPNTRQIATAMSNPTQSSTSANVDITENLQKQPSSNSLTSAITPVSLNLSSSRIATASTNSSSSSVVAVDTNSSTSSVVAVNANPSIPSIAVVNPNSLTPSPSLTSPILMKQPSFTQGLYSEVSPEPTSPSSETGVVMRSEKSTLSRNSSLPSSESGVVMRSEKTPLNRNASLMRLRGVADARHKAKAVKSKLIRYCAIYAYNKDHPLDFNFDAGDLLDFVAHVDENWTRVRRADGSEGIAPNNFMQQIEAQALEEAKILRAHPVSLGGNVKALHDYVSQDGSGFGFKSGDVMEVMSIVDENWIYVRRLNDATGDLGLAPVNYVTLS